MAIINTNTSVYSTSGFSKFISRILNTYHRCQEFRMRRRQIAELRSVDPRILRDMAIDRSEASSIVNTGGKERRRNCKS
ncbi:MAG: DUF1127 domain-containing protein [Rhizobiaceae bacterium]